MLSFRPKPFGGKEFGGNPMHTAFLCHFDGTNNGQNLMAQTGQVLNFIHQTHLDTSQHAFATDVSSLKCDGTTDGVDTLDSVLGMDVTFGTSDFTVDFWVKFNGISPVIEFLQFNDNDYTYSFELYTANKLQMYFKVNSFVFTYNAIMTNAWAGVTTGVWYHLAFVKWGVTPYIFINGTSQALTQTGAIGYLGDYQGNFAISGDSDFHNSCLNGWIDEVRILKGIAQWKANFTPPTRNYTI